MTPTGTSPYTSFTICLCFPSLHLMARFAVNLYDSGAGPLSPSVYWELRQARGLPGEGERLVGRVSD
jgi:hypothetical protein